MRISHKMATVFSFLATFGVLLLFLGFSESRYHRKRTRHHSIIRNGFRKPYEGDKVFHLFPEDKEQVTFLKQFLDAPGEHFDYWKAPSMPGELASLHVNANWLRTFYGLMNSTDIRYRVAIKDVRCTCVTELEKANKKARLRQGPDAFVNAFHDHYDIRQWLQKMANSYPNLATFSRWNGSSYEGRDLMTIKIGSKIGKVKKDAIFVEALIHAREWLSMGSAIYIIDKMLRTYETDETVKRMVDTYDFYIMPVANPDGYTQTQWGLGHRLWRKNFQPVRSNPNCFGTDLNRNWDFRWGEARANYNCYSESYNGVYPFSQMETAAMKKFIEANKSELLAYFALHAYGQFWLIPYSTEPKPDDYEELERVANIGVKALMAVNKAKWKVGRSQDFMYEVSGTSVDWVKSQGVRYAYTLELSPTQNIIDEDAGFCPLPDRIEPSGREVWAGLVAAIDAMKN